MSSSTKAQQLVTYLPVPETKEYCYPRGKQRLVVDILYELPVEPHVDNDYAPVMLQMEYLWRAMNDKFLHREKSIGLPALTDQYLILAAKLKVLAEQRLLDIARDKVKYAPHPTFLSL